jgi:thiol-disulfide isomerase/thioredoxin
VFYIGFSGVVLLKRNSQFVLLAVLLANVILAHADVKLGESLPSKLGFDTEGELLAAKSRLGKYVVIHFWSPECTRCLQKLSLLNTLAKRHSAEQLEVIAISSIENEQLFRKFVKRLGDIPITFANDDSRRVARKLDVDELPTIVLVNPDGKVEQAFYGDLIQDSKSVIAGISEYLAGQ